MDGLRLVAGRAGRCGGAGRGRSDLCASSCPFRPALPAPLGAPALYSRALLSRGVAKSVQNTRLVSSCGPALTARPRRCLAASAKLASMLGLSGVAAIMAAVASGRKLETLELTEFPNMPFLYWLAVAGALAKPKWTEERKWPALKVTMASPTPIAAPRLKAFRKLAGWPDEPAGSSSATVPMMFLMAESFRLVMQVLTLPAFPVSVLGTVVNKRARYVYLRAVPASASLTYSCSLNPAVRDTFSGHAEFDLLLEAADAASGEVVWQAVLSLVLMNPKKAKKAGGAKPAEQQQAAEAAGAEVFDTWVLLENTGRAYAALDGDISPMHLHKLTAALMGFPAPVANVHLLAARAEASVALKKGAPPPAPTCPFSLELEFKKPTLLPNRLSVSGPSGYDAAAGYKLAVDDKKGKPIAAGSVSSKASVTRF